jgi:hypothetical protein
MVNQAVIGIIPVMATLGPPTTPTEEDLQKGFKTSYRDIPPGASRTQEQKEFALPIEYWKDGERYDAVAALKECIKPKLVIYGSRDEFTPVGAVKKLYEEIPEPKMLQEIDTTHDYRYFPEAIEAVNLGIGKFLERNSFI